MQVKHLLCLVLFACLVRADEPATDVQCELRSLKFRISYVWEIVPGSKSATHIASGSASNTTTTILHQSDGVDYSLVFKDGGVEHVMLHIKEPHFVKDRSVPLRAGQRIVYETQFHESGEPHAWIYHYNEHFDGILPNDKIFGTHEKSAHLFSLENLEDEAIPLTAIMGARLLSYTFNPPPPLTAIAAFLRDRLKPAKSYGEITYVGPSGTLTQRSFLSLGLHRLGTSDAGLELACQFD